jgi:succinate dehydrogenase / fumarate reductase cytochrome b subunit
MTTILIADDDPAVRAGIRQLLEEDRGVTDIGEAASGNETLEQLGARSWDLLLMEIDLPDCKVPEILGQIRRRYPDTKVLVLSSLPEGQYAMAVLKAGAHGYLPKAHAPQNLVRAARAVLQGRRYLSADLGGDLGSDSDATGRESPLQQSNLLKQGIGMEQRPLSPFLIYRWAYTMTLSILHRVTGIALSVGLLALVGWLLSASLGSSAYATLLPALQSWPVQVLIALAIVALIYHFCNGVRHLAWDMGWGFERPQARASGAAVVIVTVVASAICIYFLFRHSQGAS